MLYCENGHQTNLRVQVSGLGGILLADSQHMLPGEVEAIVYDIQEGVCPLCTGTIPLLQNSAR